jgi:hypothetical protein
MRHLVLTLAVLVPLCLSAVTLVEDGRAEAEIIIPAQANDVEKFAARELVEHLRLLSGSELPVLEAASGNAHATIRLGRASGLDLAGLPANAGRIRVNGKTIDLAGIDGAGEPLNFRTPAGTLFAVYEFLESLGIRWLWPGELGALLPPKQATLEVADGDRAVAAPLPFCSWRLMNTASNWMMPADAKPFQQQEKVWLRRHRFTEVVSLSYGHAFTAWFKDYGQKSPEFFNLLPDGTRRPDPLGRFANRPDLVSLCVSNPLLTRQIVADWVAKGAGPVINLNENDTAGKCTCPACLAADGSDDAFRLERAKNRYQAGDGLWYRELGSVTDRYAQWYLNVLAEADRVAPGAQARAIGCIYANYYEPPSIHLNERVLLRFCPPLMYPWTAEKVAKFQRLWKGWSDSGARLMLRPNFTLDGHGFPLLYYRDFIDCFDFAYAHGMIAADLDSLTGMYGANGLTTYTVATKFSRPQATAEQIFEEYLQAFGAAAPVLRQYFTLLDEAVHNAPVTEDFSLEGGRYADFYLVAAQVFTPEVMRRASTLLEEASRLAAQDGLALARVRFVRLGFDDAMQVLAVQTGYEEFQRSGNPNAFVTALKKLQKHRAEHEQEGYANVGFLRMMEGRNWPLHLALLGSDSRELTGWEIRFDPQRDGDALGCPQGRGDGWQPIVLDRHWERSDPGIAWEKKHGAPHKGLAWYRCRFTVSTVNPEQPLKLTFGAVDGDADIWLNGTHVATHEYPYRGDPDSWKKPFDVEASGAIRDGENLLVVRVDKKQNGLSGIWRPVFLSMGEVQAESIFAGGWREDTRAGRFSFQSREYPLSIAAHEADNAQLNVNKGIWGRLFRTETVKVGQHYQLDCTYRTMPGCQGNFAVWLRSGQGKELNRANVNFPAPNTNGEWRTLAIRFLPETDKCTIYLTLTGGVGVAQIHNLTVSPVTNLE